MVELIVAVILALISYFSSKKAGASDAQAATVAAAAGLGSYYVATQTDWGKSLFSDTSGDWVAAVDSNGQALYDEYGECIYVPQGEQPLLDSDGKIRVESDGTWFTKTLDTTGKVLSSWGGAGTAAVIGTSAAAAGGTFSDLGKYMPWILLGLGVYVLVK